MSFQRGDTITVSTLLHFVHICFLLVSQGFLGRLLTVMLPFVIEDILLTLVLVLTLFKNTPFKWCFIFGNLCGLGWCIYFLNALRVLTTSLSLGPHGLYCSPWNSPGQNTGVGSLSLLQGIFPTQGSNPGVPHCRRSLPAEPPGKLRRCQR